MHEHGIAQQILNLAFEYAKQNGANRITQFHIEMSQTEDESEDALRFHLEMLARGTPAEGAQFEIRRVPAVLRCLRCGHQFESEQIGAACPHCHSTRVMPKANDAFRLVSIEVD